MKVVSLFDGISCLRVALGNCEVEYHAFEIDKDAVKISSKNYPDIVHHGDVRELTEKIEDVDLLCGGSPCQDLSIAKKDRKGLDGERSGLFWEYVRILKLLNPKYFILENVASMSKEAKETISKELGVEPIMIDASLVSAQSRKRLFWTNIPNVTQPENRNIMLKDILEPEAEPDTRMTTKDGKAYCLTATYKGAALKNSIERKQRTMVKIKEAVCGRNVGRRLKDGHRADDDVTIPYQRRIETRSDGKSGSLTSVMKDNLVIKNDNVRKLTPIECERLQSLPDNYTEGISKTKRYKALGNGFNVEVIKHILSFIPSDEM